MSPEKYLSKVVRTVCDVMGYGFGTVMLMPDESLALPRMVGSYNLPRDFMGNASEMATFFVDIFIRENMNKGRPFVVDEPAPWEGIPGISEINTLICVPLLSRGAAFGACFLCDTVKRHVSDEEIDVLEWVAVNMSVAAGCYNQVEQLRSRVDKLQDETDQARHSANVLGIARRRLGKALRTRLERDRDRAGGMDSLWNLTRMIDASHKEICDRVLDEITGMTRSKYALYGFVNEDENVLRIYSCSRDVLADCRVREEDLKFPVDKGGLWAVAVRQKKALVVNDYNAAHPGKKGTVSGHVALKRLLCVPVLTRGRVVALAVCANKPSDYSLDDVKQVETFCTNVQVILERKQAMDELNKHVAQMDLLVRDRTAKLEEEIRRHRATEQALRKSEEEKNNILQTMSEIVVYLDRDRKVLWANRAAAESVGLSPDELIGRYCFREWHQRNQPCPTCPGTKIYETGRARTGEIHTPDGRIWHFKGYPVKDDNGEVVGIVQVTEEVTLRVQAQEEKKRLEAQLYQAQKMKAIGTLAGGIAHDFNNLLMGIQGHASLMLAHIDRRHPLFNHVEGIGAMVERGAELTRQLLGFARGGKYNVKPADINALVKNAVSMFGRTRKEIRIHEKYQDGIWTVEVDPGQIEQVLLNIFINAWQAMEGGGDLYIETSHTVLDEHYHRPFEVVPGNYVRISITDTGVGMDKATCQRIFEPFFTTRDVGRGTGLGLASAYGIIKNHGGIINVYSEKGVGTTFKIYLPASDRDVSVEEDSPVSMPVSGSETILLVDDEDVIIEVGQDMLRHLGYRVLTAGSGKDAIRVFRENRDEIDLVILDMIMPDMGGGEVYDRIREADSNVKVILSSGYSMNGEAARIMRRGCSDFIQKPFNIGALSAAIRGVLDDK